MLINMSSEEIIQRLLDEKKITAKEAMIILKDLAKIGAQQILPDKFIPDDWKFPEPENPYKSNPLYQVVTMYGVLTNPYSYDDTIPTTKTNNTNTINNGN